MKTRLNAQLQKMHKGIGLVGICMTRLFLWRISFLNLRFRDLKLFKKELVDILTKRGFEFRYIKNDAMRVRVVCSEKKYKWLISCL